MFEAVSAPCPACLAKLELTITTKGADSWLHVECKICHHKVFSSTPKTVRDGKFSENNIKLVLSSLQTGEYSRTATTSSTKLGFDGMSSSMEKYLESKDSNRKRLAEAPKIPSKKASVADCATGNF